MYVCFGHAGLPIHSLSMLPGWLDRKRLGWLGQLHCFAFALSCLHAIASYNSRSWKPSEIWYQSRWTCADLDLKKIPGLTCRSVLASVDVKCKGENERSFELFLLTEGSLEVKLPTIWTDGKAEVARVREAGEEQKREDQRRERVRRKKMQVREKVGKSRFTVFFQWFVAPEGRQVGSLKRRVRSHLARREMTSCTPLWREAHLQVKKLKTPHVRSTFWKLRCRKSARRCGAKHISKSKV